MGECKPLWRLWRRIMRTTEAAVSGSSPDAPPLAPPPNFGWLIPGELAGCARPPDLTALAAQGVRAVITLTRKPLPDAALRAADLEMVHLPVADFTAPSQTQIAAAVAAIDRFLAVGHPVAVHCAAGLGRTGTILACALVSRGATASAAIAAVRAARPGSIETRRQEKAVREWAMRGEG